MSIKRKALCLLPLLLACIFILPHCSDDNGGDDDNTDTESDTTVDTETDTGTDTGVDTTPPEENNYGADDDNIRYVGRFDFTDPTAPVASAPGVYVQARFTGTGVTVHLRDEHLWGHRNYYDVYVDGEVAAMIEPIMGTSEYPVVDDLENTTHEVMLVKRTESNIGKGTFLGFTFAGEIEAPPEPRPRRFVVFGDSIQAGSGVEGVDGTDECADWILSMPLANGHMSPGAITARALDGDYHLAAVGGMGLIQNYEDTYEPRHIPDVYNLTFIEDTPGVEHDMSAFVPDAVIIALGTNDWGTGPETDTDYPRPGPTPEEFAAAYIAFVDTLLVHWPDAWIFGVSSQMLGDGWPDPTDTRLSNQIEALGILEENYSSEKVVAVEISKQMGSGCGTHPDVDNNLVTADEMETAIRAATGW